MDNILQILIYLIIIIAFLNSLFKKKDKSQSPRLPSGSPGPQQPDNYSSTEIRSDQNKPHGEYDILKEIEVLFKNEKTVSAEKPKLQSTIEKASIKRIPVEYTTGDEHRESESEHELNQNWHRITPFKRTVQVDSTIEKEAKSFERWLEDQKVEDYSYSDISKNLYSPQSLREYFIFSEILGKPKYLRR